MNGYQVPEFIKKGEYHIMSDEEKRAQVRKDLNRGGAIKLLTILMAADQPLTSSDILARVGAWLDKRTQEDKPFYFYYIQSSFIEYLDDLTDVILYGFLDRIEQDGVVKYQANKHGLKKFEQYRGWLERYLEESIEHIKQSFPPPTS